MTILIFFAVLFVLILVHEWGHFIVAKKTGMRVDEFGIGFPPRLLTKKIGETEYTLNAIPIGGFVRILGENGTFDGEELSEEDKKRTFDARPKWAQALVLIAGVTMNFLFAWFLFTLTFMIGVPTPVEEVDATDQAELYVAGVLPDAPASVLPVGSVVEEIRYGDTVVVSPTPSEFSGAVEMSNDSGVSVTYNRGDTRESVVLTPEAGLLEQDPERRAVGVSLVLVDEERYPIHEALWNSLGVTWERTVFIATSLWGLIRDAFIGQPDLSAVAGPVGIVGLVGDAASDGIVALLAFTAMISLSLAVFNLLPFPALDGGRLVFVAIEAITRKKIPPEWAGRVNLVGFALLMLLMIAVTYNDITRLF
tara:strand:+ start:12718 stop:13812 length:1095 start_codon:yes stop_codon:yes gene_type:complete